MSQTVDEWWKITSYMLSILVSQPESAAPNLHTLIKSDWIRPYLYTEEKVFSCYSGAI